MNSKLGMLVLVMGLLGGEAVEAAGREQVALRSPVARVTIDLGGGAIGEFRLNDLPLNPLNWAAPAPDDHSIRAFGHFLCLDRWGPPSQAEAARGMPYHGEASNVRWAVEGQPTPLQLTMVARLPKAGLFVRRTVRLAPSEALFTVREEVKNENDLGRIFNMVQHPTIAPPFLDESTVVDCSAARGLAQGGTLPNPEEPFASWPNALKKSGETVNLRHLGGDADPNVVSFEIPGKLGWVTAANPAKGLLIGYLWRTSDYPWVSLWRDVRDQKPAARGLEFGTTGLHQPFPILVKKSRIWDRALFEYLDAGETIVKEYAGFLHRIPSEFRGVETIALEGNKVLVKPKGTPEFSIRLGDLFTAPAR